MAPNIARATYEAVMSKKTSISANPEMLDGIVGLKKLSGIAPPILKQQGTRPSQRILKIFVKLEL